MDKKHQEGLCSYAVMAIFASYEGKDVYFSKYKPALEARYEDISAVSEFGAFVPAVLQTVKYLETEKICVKHLVKGKKFKLHSVDLEKLQEVMEQIEKVISNEEIADISKFVLETKAKLEENIESFSVKGFLDSLN